MLRFYLHVGNWSEKILLLGTRSGSLLWIAKSRVVPSLVHFSASKFNIFTWSFECCGSEAYSAFSRKSFPAGSMSLQAFLDVSWPSHIIYLVVSYSPMFLWTTHDSQLILSLVKQSYWRDHWSTLNGYFTFHASITFTTFPRTIFWRKLLLSLYHEIVIKLSILLLLLIKDYSYKRS